MENRLCNETVWQDFRRGPLPRGSLVSLAGLALAFVFHDTRVTAFVIVNL
jgi:hypothetical protein